VLKLKNKKKIIMSSGKRKTAVARATLRPGTGKIKINNKPIALFGTKIYQLRIQEPILLSEKIAEKVDISIKVHGGGIMGQSDAIRMVIAKVLVEYAPELKQIFLNYDRQLLVADVRFKETTKPNRHGRARAKKQKSYR